MMNTKVIAFAFLFAVAIVSVLAAKDAETATNNQTKNMTYGQCVSNIAELKNTCYSNAETQRKTCESGNQTDSCKADYKKAKDICKKDFKAAKKECARTTKPGFFEKMRYAFK